MKFLSRSLFVLYITIFITACSSPASENPSTNVINPVQLVECKDPRPQICTREYMPVCATKMTNLKCEGKHCPITQKVTYATGCTACADPKVLSYTPEKCQ